MIFDDLITSPTTTCNTSTVLETQNARTKEARSCRVGFCAKHEGTKRTKICRVPDKDSKRENYMKTQHRLLPIGMKDIINRDDGGHRYHLIAGNVPVPVFKCLCCDCDVVYGPTVHFYDVLLLPFFVDTVVVWNVSKSSIPLFSTVMSI